MPSWLDEFLQDAYFLDLGDHKVPLLKAIDHACTLYFSRTDVGNDSTNWVIRHRAKYSEEEQHPLQLFALDFVGLAIAYGHLDYVVSEVDPRQLDTAYLSYLTLILSFRDPLRLYGAWSQDQRLHTLASKWLEILLEHGGRVNRTYWLPQAPFVRVTPWTAFLSAALQIASSDYSLASASTFSETLPHYIKFGADMSINLTDHDVWRGNRVERFMCCTGGKHTESLEQSLRGHIWRPPTTAPVPQYSLQVSTSEEFEARTSTTRSNYMIQNDPQDDDYHSYVLWFTMSPVFALQHIQRSGGQTLSDLDHLNPSTTALPHWEPVCICRPDIDIAAILSSEDSMALVESYEAMEAVWRGLRSGSRQNATKK
ncbi:hypothetical protein LTR10_017919 [Elasticomyces elasticus]|uniref:ER-bound oxygenase mpaB/mpaB'/Rubber oxygenase catalytic domain-containing protein n=1 Tax=Exophiala sideris TaxID=1016849 RepID=A0ABR0IWX6_9EURO|nr:hypothetical protein LTR10_017919 [Elasticomyces elasticus]KAK5021789.1 hypothetical protein LTS07_010684 [Exophiala sideris]KAK5025851.1 hypothetical protein LTR13_010315 [Exophiala sideris]KAK5050215.1 hypothetical protein LTR69_010703 [Exophiala sideris]KAK5177026.1 hypothetical protein LTR44_010463 [Eurotiomycetes sp. CCFEE 6388]